MKKVEKEGREFLSGEANLILMANRFSLHQSITNNDASFPNRSDSGKNTGFGNSESVTSSPLIQVVDENDGNKCKEKTEKNQYTKRFIESKKFTGLDTDDTPPPLFDPHLVNSSTQNNKDTKLKELKKTDGPSMMEMMMTEALKIKKKKKSQQVEKERKNSSKDSFASGLKKGFLSNNSKSKKTKSRTKDDLNTDSVVKEKGINFEKEEDKIYELDKEGNLIATTLDDPPPLNPDQSKKALKDSIPTIKPSSTNKKKNPLTLDEVQEAMMKDSSNYLQNNAQEWATPELMEKTISQNPTLVSGFMNPNYKAALEEFQANPKSSKVKEKMAIDLEFRKFIQEFMQVMGNHFIQLGDKQKQSSKNKKEPKSRIGLDEVQSTAPNRAHTSKTEKKVDLGPYVERSLQELESKTNDKSKNQRESSNKKGTKANPIEKMNKKEKEQVQKILQDKELTNILMDPNFQRVMQDCSTPGKMQKYMHHPEYGRKLRKLIEAGLLKIA